MKKTLFILVISQFFCTSMWFAGNAVVDSLLSGCIHCGADNPVFYLSNAALTGFILGTLVFAILGISDRFSPSKVFAFNALIGAILNLSTVVATGYHSVLLFRLATGFFLAGLYPVGMKIASDHFGKDIGKALGFLLGALALGSASPNLIRYLQIRGESKAEFIFVITSVLAVIGGALVLFFIADGPFRSPGKKFSLKALGVCFKDKDFKGAAFGYFGHMWELYAFWTIVPLLWSTFNEWSNVEPVNMWLMSFLVIAVGSIGCVVSTQYARKRNPANVAAIVLGASGLCCLISPMILNTGSFQLLMIFLLVWGFFVIADSPLFSSMVAMYAEPSVKGSALTMVNCIGFSITVIAIEVVKDFTMQFDLKYGLLILAPGPVFGVWALIKFRSKPCVK